MQRESIHDARIFVPNKMDKQACLCAYPPLIQQLHNPAGQVQRLHAVRGALETTISAFPKPKIGGSSMNDINYLRGLHEGLELTGRHTRLNLRFAFSLGFLLALALAGLFGGGV